MLENAIKVLKKITDKGYKAYIDGSVIALRYGANNATGFILNSSGNVTIGGSDLAGTGAKLFVDGATFVNSIKSSDQHPTLGNAGGGGYLVIGNLNLGLELWTRSDGHSALQAHRLNGTAEAFNLMLQPLGGNVLIGTATDSGYKLDVTGDSRINGALRVQRLYDTNSYLDIVASDVSVSYNAYDNSDGWCLQYFRCQDKTIMTLAADGANINGNLIVSGDVASA